MKIAVIDADLIAKTNHRFPNLACMKISGYYKKIGAEVELKTDYNYLGEYDKIFISKVFTDTKIPGLYLTMPNVEYGGTGFFYDKAPKLPDEIEHCMPDYTLYNKWIDKQLKKGKEPKDFLYYTDYSIGFLTRGCFRKCSFCVNKNYDKVEKASLLSEFYNASKKKICLLDDNFLGYENWKMDLIELQMTNKPFQFKQGLDARLLTNEKCELLFASKYDNEFIFAFDNIADKNIIIKKLNLIRKYITAIPKFYCLCAYDRSNKWDKTFWIKDIFDLLERIKILMHYKCLPYVMRYVRYTNSPYHSMYTIITSWTNQPNFFKQISLRQFVDLRNRPNEIKSLTDFANENPEIQKYYDMKF